MGIRTSERWRESLYWLNAGLTDRLTDTLIEWLCEWNLWNTGGLKLEVSRSLTSRVWTDKRREKAAYSITGPLAFCGLHLKKWSLASSLLGWCALEQHFLPLFVVQLLKTKAKGLSAGQGVSTSHSDQGSKQLHYPLFEITFCDTLPMRTQKAGLIFGTAEWRPFHQ